MKQAWILQSVNFVVKADISDVRSSRTFLDLWVSKYEGKEAWLELFNVWHKEPDQIMHVTRNSSAQNLVLQCFNAISNGRVVAFVSSLPDLLLCQRPVHERAARKSLPGEDSFESFPPLLDRQRIRLH